MKYRLWATAWMLITLTPAFGQGVDSIFLKSSDTALDQSRLRVTNSALDTMAEIVVERSRLSFGTNAILTLGTYDPDDPATPDSALAGDLRFLDDDVIVRTGSGTDDKLLRLGPLLAQGDSSGNVLLHLDEIGADTPNLVELDVDGITALGVNLQCGRRL